MNIFPLLLISLTSVGCLTAAKEDSGGETTLEMEGWLDPGDMLQYDADRVDMLESPGCPQSKPTDCGQLQAKLSQCQKDLENLPLQCPACAEKAVVNASPCDTPYFKKLVRTILGNIEDRGDHEVMVTASSDDVSTLEKFVTSEHGNVQDVSEVLVGIISNFKGKDDLFVFGQWDTSSLSYVTQEAILIFIAFVLVICAAVIFEMRTKLPWRSQLWFVLFICFVVSIPWEWIRLYRKAFASKQAQMEKEIPKQCRPDHELQPLESLKLWLRNSFTFSDDMCTRYQETLLVDPIWEVSPAKAISATVATIIAQPFEHLAEAMGKSFRALFKEVPIQWQPFVFTAVILIIIISMFTLSGLQVKLPFMTITTVPALPGNFQADLQQIENQIQNVRAGVDRLNDAAGQRDAIDNAPLHEDIHNQQIQILELLQAMKEQQQRRDELAIQGANNQQAQRALAPAEAAANIAGADEERPERAPVMETPKLKLPVQNSEQDVKFSVEDVGASGES